MRLQKRCATRPRRWVRSALIGAVGAVSIVPASATWAGVGFASGSDATFRHDPDRDSSAVSPKIVEILTVPTSASMPSYHISKTFSSGSSDTTAFGSLGHVTNSTTASFVLKPGTGVTQDDPGNAAYPGASSLKINIDTIWNVTSGGFGPLATGYISLGVGGVVGDGGYAKFIADLSFTDPTTGASLRSDWVISRTFSDAGSFAKTFTTSEVFNGLQLSSGQKIKIKGYIEFRASNAETPSSILPTDIEIGGAPPTATWAGVQGGVWDDPRFWVQPDEPNPEALPPVPNEPGHRARFVTQERTPQQIFVNKPVTIGTLDVDSLGALSFVGEVPMTFRALSGPAVLNVRNVQDDKGNGTHALLLPAVQLDSPLEMKTDSLAVFTIGSQLRGKQGVTKLGDGLLRLTNENLFTGGTSILGGELHADATGALGTGPVVVSNGLLAYNAVQAAASDVAVQVLDGGVVDLGVVPTSSDRFVVQAGGVISGNGQELGALAIGENLQIEAGAVISHTDFSTGQEGNPKGLGTTPLYIFGLTESEFEQHFFMGTGAATPWRGIGGTRGDVTFGTSSRALGIATDGELLVPTGGTLRVNATIGALDGKPATLRKTGAGKAVLTSPNNLEFTSLVERGTLQIDGTHPGDVSVSPGAVLSGTGNIGGIVTTREGKDGIGARIAPGTSVGTLTVRHLELTPDAQLDFELNTTEQSDRINVLGNLVLDGHLNITELPDFEPRSYPLIDYWGTLKDNGLEIGQASDAYAYTIDVVPTHTRPGGYIRLNVLGEKQWDVDGSGQWADPRMWLGPVPDVAGSRANFLGKLTKGAADIALDGDKTVGRMRFDNVNPYNIVPAAGGSLRLDNAGDGALVEVETGRHAINVPVVAVDDAEIDVNEGHSLSAPIAIAVSAGRTLKKTGEGFLDAGQVTLGTGSLLKVNQGAMRATNLRGGTVSIREGVTLQIRSNGTPNGTSRINELVIEGEPGAWEGRLDLRDNDLIVQGTPATRGLLLTQLHDQIRMARNTGLLPWSGNGIGTSTAARDPLVGLAVALNDSGDGTPIFTSFGGQDVDVNSLLVKFSWTGDATLDGVINFDDYFRIDSSFLEQPADPTYAQGDFNYDGRINFDDYFLIDSAFLGQTGVLGGGEGAALVAAAVPEPSVLVLAAMTCGVLLCRRRARGA